MGAPGVPISSYIAVMLAMLLHLIEALIMGTTESADGSIGMAALLGLSPHRWVVITWLVVSSAAAAVVLSAKRLSPLSTILLLTPQQVLLMTTAIAAWMSVWHGAYADGIARSSLFITADQLPRGMASIMHLSAIYGLAAFHSRGT